LTEGPVGVTKKRRTVAGLTPSVTSWASPAGFKKEPKVYIRKKKRRFTQKTETTGTGTTKFYQKP